MKVKDYKNMLCLSGESVNMQLFLKDNLELWMLMLLLEIHLIPETFGYCFIFHIYDVLEIIGD